MTETPTYPILDYARTLGLAFFDDPLFRYAFPKDHHRVKKLTQLLAPTIQAAQTYGGVEPLPNSHGILTWLDGQAFPLSLGSLMKHGLLKVLWHLGPWDLGRLMKHDTYAEEKTLEAALGRFAYIWCLGVHPEYSGQGLGTRLMERTFYTLRSKGYEYCLLRTENPNNVRFYRNRGFAVVHQERVEFSGLEFWVLRQAL